MKALSIQQPWAWAILFGGKNIENRTWSTRRRGHFLIHTGKKFDMDGWRWIDMNKAQLGLVLPDHIEFKAGTAPGTQMGGILGSVELADCVASHSSQWFFGPHGFVLRNPQILSFQPCLGKLGFFQP